MAEHGDAPAFPVVFFDGKKESNIGSVKISPALEYKTFQLMLSQKIGISPNQISIYLVDLKKAPAMDFREDQRRIPITGKVNFGLICRQKNCCFLVVLKRSRKSRNRRDKTSNCFELSDFILDRCEFSTPLPPPPLPPPPKNLILLKRNQPSQFHYQLAMGRGEVNSPQLGSDHGLYPGPGPYLDFNHSPKMDGYFGVLSSIMTAKNDGEIFCKDCVKEKDAGGNTPSFHHCVRDAVITGFSTRLGPINRPVKPPL